MLRNNRAKTGFSGPFSIKFYHFWVVMLRNFEPRGWVGMLRFRHLCTISLTMLLKEVTGSSKGGPYFLFCDLAGCPIRSGMTVK